jgi:hypothetical protein
MEVCAPGIVYADNRTGMEKSLFVWGCAWEAEVFEARAFSEFCEVCFVLFLFFGFAQGRFTTVPRFAKMTARAGVRIVR